MIEDKLRSIIPQYRRDPITGEMISQQRTETVIVSPTQPLVITEEIIEEFPRLTVRDELDNYLIEVFNFDDIATGKFYVNYTSRRVYLYSDMCGKKIKLSYFGMGCEYIDSGIIYSSLNSEGKVSQTLKNILESGGSDNLVTGSVINGSIMINGNETNVYTHPSGATITNPHNTTKTDIGLSNVNNTSDINKPISNATQTAINLKVDKAIGKSLVSDTEITKIHTHSNKTILDNTTASYTTEDKTKLDTLSSSGSNLSDINATDLTDNGDTILHYHATDRNRTNHSGTQLASTISDFASTVKSTVLTGLITTTNAVISATDTVLGALGKLQKQITDNLTTLISHTGNVSNPHIVTKTQVGLANAENTADNTKSVLSATKLVTPRTINGVSFDGSVNITVTDNTKATQTDINNSVNAINIGVRNLIIKTGEIVNTMISTDGTTSSLFDTNLMLDFIPVVAGEQLMFSQISTGAGDNYFRYAFYQSNKTTLVRRTANNNLSFSDIVPVGSLWLRVSYDAFNKVKLERGTKVTGWLPSPEDVDNAIALKVDKVAGKSLILDTEITRLSGIATNANNYSLPVATTSIGGVKTGTDITVDASGNVSVNDDSHNHVIANVDGLQTALDSKIDDAQVLTNVPLGAVFTDTTYSIATQSVNGLMLSTDKTKLDGISTGANKVLNSATNGNILINGVETNVYTHSTGTNPHGTTKADVGLSNVDNTADSTKNVLSASKLTTVRTIATSGDATGTATSFDGSSNISIPLTLATVATAGTYKSVTVDAKGRVTSGSNPTTLSGYGITDALASSTYTASDILTKIKTVDGLGSGLDADLLDGNEASAFALASHGTHVTYGTTTTSLTSGGTGIIGVATTLSRSDHTHTLPTYPTLSSLGLTATLTELNYTSGVTSNIQTQLNTKVDDGQVLTNVPIGALFTDTVYTHPTTHPSSIIVQDSSNRFVTDTEKTTWNGKVAQSDIDTSITNIKLGIRNLISRYGELVNTMVDTTGLPGFLYDSSLMVDFIPVVAGELLTFSQTAIGIGTNYFRYAFFQSDKTTLIIRKANLNLEFTDTVPAGALWMRVSYDTTNTVKIERGNKATGWLPAIEDKADKTTSGITATRPTPTYIGQTHFDTTLGKPIWCKTVTTPVWVDSTGATV